MRVIIFLKSTFGANSVLTRSTQPQSVGSLFMIVVPRVHVPSSFPILVMHKEGIPFLVVHREVESLVRVETHGEEQPCWGWQSHAGGGSGPLKEEVMKVELSVLGMLALPMRVTT